MSDTNELPSLESVIEALPDPISAAPAVAAPEAAPAPAPEAQAAPEATQPPPATKRLAEMVGEQRLFEQHRSQKEAEDANFAKVRAIEEALADPKKLLAMAQSKGLSYEDLTKAVNEGRAAPDPIKPVKDDLAAVRAELAQLKAEKAAAAKQAAIDEARGLTHKFLETNKDKYPLINGLGYGDLVFQKMYTTLTETGQVIREEDAAATIEAELGGVKEKFFKLFQPETAPQVKTAPPSKSPPVVSNQTASKVATTRQPDAYIEDKEEALAAAIALLENA